MNNILYFMHVPWGWIRQRPHFIAEGLSASNNISVVYEKPFRAKNLVNNITGINLHELFRLPIKRYSFLYFINVYIVSKQLKKKCKAEGFDVIWITDVRLFPYIRKLDLDGIKVIYDCMDETLEFAYILNNNKIKNTIKSDELSLVNQAEHVFCSSKTILNRMIERTRVNTNKLSVINNALDVKNGESAPVFLNKEFDKIVNRIKENDLTLITYVGTVSEWLDIECIMQSINSNPKVAYLLVGPAEISLPTHDRLFHLGPIEHVYVDYILSVSQILVMPFKLSRLIESVDPVKLYEYVRSSRPVVAPEYDESLRFSNYINLYNTTEEYTELINKISADNCMKNKITVKDFVTDNSWDKRVVQMQQCLDLL